MEPPDDPRRPRLQSALCIDHQTTLLENAVELAAHGRVPLGERHR